MLQIALFGDDVDRSATNTGRDLQSELRDALDLSVNVTFVDENTALEALCEGQPAAAWVSAFTYAAARNTCNVQPALALVRGNAPLTTVGRSAEIVTPTSITELDQLAAQTFCRSQEHDLFTTWIYPGLLLSAQNIDPITDIETVVDYPDDLSLLYAMLEGTCTATALPPGIFEDQLVSLALLASTDQNTVTINDIGDQLHVLVPAGDTSAPAGSNWSGYDSNVIPYEVFVFAPESSIPEAMRENIVDAAEDFFMDRTDGDERLKSLLDASDLIKVEESSFASFRALIASSKWNMVYVE